MKKKKKIEFIIEDQIKTKNYNQIWDKIKELINSVDGVNFGFSDYFRDHGVIKCFSCLIKYKIVGNGWVK